MQPGFALLAAGYLLLRDDPGRFLRAGRPSREGMAWIALGAPMSLGTGWLGETFLGTSHGGPVLWEVLLSDPVTIPAVAGVTFLVMAPMEELLYRGVIHGRLRQAFGALSVVLLGATLFGIMHVFMGGGLRSFPTTAIAGLALGAAYERTDNLAVPSAMHATAWIASMPL